MALSISVRCTLLVIAILFAGIFTGCLPVRERLAARAERSGGDYRAECGILTSIALAEYLYHSHTNTGNNIARSSFCTRGWLFAVSVLEAATIRRNLKNRRNAPPISVRCTLLIRQRMSCSESRAFGWRLLNRTPKPCKVRSCRTSIPFPHNTRNNVARSGFCTEGWLFAVSVLGTSAIRGNLKKQKKCTACFSTVHIAYQAENALQREPGVRVAITEQNAEALQGSLLQNTDTIPTQYRKQHCPFQFLHQRMAVCCICFGSCYNQAKFEYAGIESSSC